jgi:HAD superfamily hydrolase (TIGR01549 family)
MIKTIFIDLDDTLYGYEGDTRIRVELSTIEYFAKLKKIPKKLIPDLYLLFKESWKQLINENKKSSYPFNRYLWYSRFLLNLRNKIIKDKNLEFNKIVNNNKNLSFLNNKKEIEKTTKILEAFYWKKYSNIIKPFPDAKIIIPKLAKKYKLYLVTDGLRKGQNIRLKGTGLDKYFSGIICSDDVENKRKPHPDVFKRCLNVAKCKNTESVMIGDKPTRDVAGANRAKIISIWLKRGSYTKYIPKNYEIPKYKVNNFFEIWNILEDLS